MFGGVAMTNCVYAKNGGNIAVVAKKQTGKSVITSKNAKQLRLKNK